MGVIVHRVSYCDLCRCQMIRCATCNNLCCTATYGEIEGKVCPDCPAAYEEQDRLYQDCPPAFSDFENEEQENVWDRCVTVAQLEL